MLFVVKRSLVIVAVFLLAGAVVNVGVAWGCPLWSAMTPSTPFDEPRPVDIEWWGLHARGRSDQPLVMVDEGRGFAFQIVLMTAGEHELVTIEDDGASTMLLRSGSPPYDHVVRLTAGWPRESLSGEQWRTAITSPIFTFQIASLARKQVRFGESKMVCAVAPPGLGARPLRFLPLRPVWPGFAVNTLFYAATLWLLICGPFALRRVVRRRRGLCVQCGYPMGESDVCTECGEALPGRTEATA